MNGILSCEIFRFFFNCSTHYLSYCTLHITRLYAIEALGKFWLCVDTRIRVQKSNMDSLLIGNDLNSTFQDVSAKIMSFSQHGTRGVCVLSANGAISNVTLRQAATSGGTVTYEVCASDRQKISRKSIFNIKCNHCISCKY